MAKTDENILDDIKNGKMKIVSKIEYLLNYWTPIISLIIFLVGGIFWFANANDRLFTSADLKFKTEINTLEADERSINKLDERYIKRDEMKEWQETVKELTKELKDLRIELARKY